MTTRYTEACAACRNYSQLTMRVRTLSQQVLVATVIAISVAILGVNTNVSNSLPTEIANTSTTQPKDGNVDQGIAPEQYRALGYVLLFGGVVLGFFSVSLAFVDWHYQSAFSAIRNALAEMERQGNRIGAWRQHEKVRGKWHDFVASYFPFASLWLIGLAAYLVGLNWIGTPHPWTSRINLPYEAWTHSMIAIFVFGFVAIFYIGFHQGNIPVEGASADTARTLPASGQ